MVALSKRVVRCTAKVLCACAAAFFACNPAQADLALTTIIIDFADPAKRSADIEVENKGKDRVFVVAEPVLIANPGLAGERRIQEPDPEKLGLLVTPSRVILEPGERKLMRFLAVGDVGERERIYRVTVKPVVGKVSAQQSAVKVVVGYDVLVIRRPESPRPAIVAERKGRMMLFRNTGNTNVLLFNGRYCQQRCVDVETKRIYAGAEWRLRLPGPGKVRYKLDTGGKLEKREF